jgi:hypothetical protein
VNDSAAVHQWSPPTVFDRKPVQAPVRRRPRRVQRKINARAGRLHFDPTVLQPWPTRRERRESRAFVAARMKNARESHYADLERLMLHGNPR